MQQFDMKYVIQGDQKVSVHLIITVQNTQKDFKQFQ
jgi:hypothetical protein